ncbi:MAG: two-component system sensor histidine kinase CreC [Akkermansiaceae bacterium]
MRLTRLSLLCLALVMGFGFYQLTAYLLDDVGAQTFQATEEVMVDTAYVIAAMIESDLENHQLDDAYMRIHEQKVAAQIYSHLKTRIGLDIYLTDTEGVILFDSGNKQREGQDFSDYNDVARTLSGAYGARSSRLDEADPNSSILYVAAPIRNEDQIIGVLTVYKAQSDVLSFIRARRSDILIATLMIGGGILLFTIAVFVWLFQPIGKLTHYAQAITRGKRLPLPNLGKGREVNTLGKALYDMRETLEGRHYVENYVSSLTHELKSPLAAIKGSAELLAEEMPVAKREQFVLNILTETARSESLVRDLVQLTELERKPHLEHRRIINLTQLCGEVADTFSIAIKDKDVQFQQDFQLDIHIKGDEMILKLALHNLLENALSFSPAGTTLCFRLSTINTNAVIQITDEGPGLPVYAVDRVFEHFYSLPRQDSPHKGTGLGLPLVREAVMLHDGQVKLENREQAGCHATLILPLQ